MIVQTQRLRNVLNHVKDAEYGVASRMARQQSTTRNTARRSR